VNPQLQVLKQLLPKLVAKCGECIVITIDGPAGSGKTTLAKDLESELNSVHTIHMDDLYEGWSSTLTSQLTLKLLNILESVKNQGEVIYSPFDWGTEKIEPEIRILGPKYLIIEGVGSGQLAIRNSVSLALWIEVPDHLGLARVIERDGPAVAHYMPAFLVAQNIHFEKEGTKKSADYRLSGLGTV
jgi:uridine kinase